MEDQIGSDSHQKTEFETLKEEIVVMENNEKEELLQNKKKASFITFIANCIGLFFLLLWIILKKGHFYSVSMLISLSVALIIVSILFFMFRHYKLKEGAYKKYLYSNFYVLFFVFIELIIVSIFKL